MLAGVAGRTIEEARERMPIEEIQIWQAYMAKNGPLAIQRRIEYVGAQISMILANQHRDPKSKPIKLEQFLLWQKVGVQDDEVDDLHEAFGELAKVAGPRGGVDTPRKKLWVRRSA